MQMARVFAALTASLALATPASAAVVWTVEGVFARPKPPSLVAQGTGRAAAPMIDGGLLSGTFTTEEDETGMWVTEIDLMTSASGAFRSFTYDDLDMIDDDMLPMHFRLTVPAVGGMTYQLQLVFDPLLGSGGGKSFAFTGFEHQDYPGSGNRMLSGFATAGSIDAVAAPEPGTWALMLAGFGLAGMALRRRSSPLRA